MARASFLNLPTGDEAPYLLSTDGKVLSRFLTRWRRMRKP